MSVIRVAKRVQQFIPEVLPWPDEVVMFDLTGDYIVDYDKYGVETDQGWVYIRPGEWVVEVDDYAGCGDEGGNVCSCDCQAG